MADHDEIARAYRAPAARVEDTGPDADGRPRKVWLAAALAFLNLLGGFTLLFVPVYTGTYLLSWLVFLPLLHDEWAWLPAALIALGFLSFVIFGRNWARWAWMSLMLVSWLVTLYSHDMWRDWSADLVLLIAALFAVDAVAGYLLFSEPAAAWFDGSSTEEEEVRP
jgi:hypothetical protein